MLHFQTVAGEPSGLSKRCPSAPLVVNAASHFSAGNVSSSSAYSAAMLDTTGAGDPDVGVLVAALCQNQTLKHARRLARVGAGIACTKEGAQPSQPSLPEI
jgi:sugar/nucleoside kinase (ribokinase family)